MESLLKAGHKVVPATQCRKSGWDVLTPHGEQAEFVSYERFVRTSPWTGRLYVHSFSNGMASHVYLYDLKLIGGSWVVAGEHGVSQA